MPKSQWHFSPFGFIPLEGGEMGGGSAVVGNWKGKHVQFVICAKKYDVNVSSDVLNELS